MGFSFQDGLTRRNRPPAVSSCTRKNVARRLRLQERGARFYSAILARWINRDPIEEWGGANVYVFLMNSPIYGVDPRGQEMWLFAKNLDPAAVLDAAALNKQLQESKDNLEDALKTSYSGYGAYQYIWRYWDPSKLQYVKEWVSSAEFSARLASEVVHLVGTEFLSASSDKAQVARAISSNHKKPYDSSAYFFHNYPDNWIHYQNGQTKRFVVEAVFSSLVGRFGSPSPIVGKFSTITCDQKDRSIPGSRLVEHVPAIADGYATSFDTQISQPDGAKILCGVEWTAGRLKDEVK
jgi:RHS repeat-associated protein